MAWITETCQQVQEKKQEGIFHQGSTFVRVPPQSLDVETNKDVQVWFSLSKKMRLTERAGVDFK